jgi:hypothetical protein
MANIHMNRQGFIQFSYQQRFDLPSYKPGAKKEQGQQKSQYPKSQVKGFYEFERLHQKINLQINRKGRGPIGKQINRVG